MGQTESKLMKQFPLWKYAALPMKRVIYQQILDISIPFNLIESIRNNVKYI